MKLSKKFLSILLCAVIVVCAGIVFGLFVKNNKSGLKREESIGKSKSESETSAEISDYNWNNEYKKLLERIAQDNIGKNYFSLIYVNDDDIPELIVSENNDIMSNSPKLYTFYEGKVYDLGSFGSYGKITYAEKSGYIRSSSGAQGYFVDKIYELKVNSAEEIASFDDNEMSFMEEESYLAEFHFNGKSVTKEEYQKEAEKWDSINWSASSLDYELNDENICNVFYSNKY